MVIKKSLLFGFIFLILIGFASATSFNSTWNTANVGISSNTQITLPLEVSGTYDFTVDWGDGTSDDITAYNQAEVTHNYVSSEIYDVSINGIIIGWRFNNVGDKNKIIEISNWGDLNLGDNGAYFYGASNLDITAIDTLNLTGTTTLTEMFMGCNLLKANPSINNWDVSEVTNMNRAFAGARTFNQNLNNWDVSSVTDMGFMFRDARTFNQNLNNWDVSSVTDMNNMFSVAMQFNGDISNWDVSSVTHMDSMFIAAYVFNQDISNWNTSNLIDMSWMFSRAFNFNQDIINWDVSNVNTMLGVFSTAAPSDFDQNLGNWDVSSVTDMRYMFQGISLSPTNYDSLLLGWSDLSLKPNVYFDAGNSKYDSLASSARQYIVDTYNWTITDGGLYLLPKVTSRLSAKTEEDGSVTLTWDAVNEESISNLITEDIDYKVFRTTDVSSLNTTTDLPIAIVTDKLYLYDFDMITGVNYTYVVTTLEYSIFHNGSIFPGNSINFVPSDCTTNYTYTDWSDCIAELQFRTGTRICYGGGLTEINETRSCVESSSEGSSTEILSKTLQTSETQGENIKKPDEDLFVEEIPLDSKKNINILFIFEKISRKFIFEELTLKFISLIINLKYY